VSKFLTVVSLIVAAYLAWAKFGSGDPVFGEIRIKLADTGIELVGLVRMNSEGDCRDRAERFWTKVFSANPKFRLTTVKCAAAIAPHLNGLFKQRQFQATYLSFERGNSGERDGRFIFFWDSVQRGRKVLSNAGPGGEAELFRQGGMRAGHRRVTIRNRALRQKCLPGQRQPSGQFLIR